jgi:4-amino-4-deoxy-L-arabinose transferase-like glycosyltransferase
MVVNWRVVGAIGAIMLLAIGLRLWQLNISIHFLVDELSFTTGILNIRARDTTEILLPMEGTAAFPYIFAYWQSKGVEVLGRNLAGLRVASAVIGTLTIPALYGLAKALFDGKTALLAAFLLAVFPPHLHFSRIGLTEIASCLFGTLALAFLARGIISNRRLDYVIGGAMLGMTQYFHEGGRLLFTPLAVAWVIALFILWRPRARAHFRDLIMAGLAAVIVALPIYYTLVARGLPLGARISAPNITLDSEYWRNMFASGDFSQHIRLHILDSLLVYVHQQDRTFFYNGQTGLVLLYLVPVLLLGVAFALWRWRAPGPCLLILWVLATSAGNSFLTETVTVPRYVVVFPALVLLVALGIRYTLLLILPGLQRAQWLIAGGLAAVFAVLQVHYYFNEHLPIYNFAARDALPHRDGQDAILRSVKFPPGTQIHFISDSPPNGHYTLGLMSFLTDDLTVEIITTEEFTPTYVNNLNLDVDHAFYVDEATGVFSLLLRGLFDVEAPVYGPFDLPHSQQFILYYARHRDSAEAESGS